MVALYIALHDSGPALMATATALALLGIALHLSSITSFEMLALSDDYTTATTDAQRTQLMAAGEAMLVRYEGTAFHLNYVVGGTVVPLMVSAVMLRSAIFNKITAWVGMLAAVANLGLYVPTVGVMLSVLAGVAFLIWYILLGLRFRQLGKAGPPEGEGPE